MPKTWTQGCGFSHARALFLEKVGHRQHSWGARPPVAQHIVPCSRVPPIHLFPAAIGAPPRHLTFLRTKISGQNNNGSTGSPYEHKALLKGVGGVHCNSLGAFRPTELWWARALLRQCCVLALVWPPTYALRGRRVRTMPEARGAPHRNCEDMRYSHRRPLWSNVPMQRGVHWHEPQAHRGGLRRGHATHACATEHAFPHACRRDALVLRCSRRLRQIESGPRWVLDKGRVATPETCPGEAGLTATHCNRTRSAGLDVMAHDT